MIQIFNKKSKIQLFDADSRCCNTESFLQSRSDTNKNLPKEVVEELNCSFPIWVEKQFRCGFQTNRESISFQSLP